MKSHECYENVSEKKNYILFLFMFWLKMSNPPKRLIDEVIYGGMSQFGVALQICHYRSTRPEVFQGKGVLKICSKFIGEQAYRSVISIQLQSNFIEITPRHGCSTVNLLHILGTPFSQNTSRWLLLSLVTIYVIYFCLLILSS